MTPAERIKSEAPNIVSKYSKRSNTRAFIQILNTFIPYFGLFYLAMDAFDNAIYWLSAVCIFLLALFLVRIFMIMHDCGHKSLFRTQALNKVFGFISGVMVGIPGYVWANHHAYHHATNGNWAKYRGPLSTISIDEFEQLSPFKQKLYRFTRRIYMALPGAFLYFIFNPRFNWMLGTIKFLSHVTLTKLKHLGKPLKTIVAEYNSPYWKDAAEYWHMAGNNVVLLSVWFAASWYFGAATFFTVYISSLVLAGAAGIIIFTIQHNFEGAYAADDSNWDYFHAALAGTSFLTWPRIANWFSADIAYHHIHHLSSTIPNYNLEQAHKEYGHLFEGVKKVRLRDVVEAFDFILWDNRNHRIISIEQYRAMQGSN
ncbi:MAG: fatty acid desaturase [Gammaproteobacteria bacterium]|nr:fatty acid desaturase [Gammaproteobacteria bacterium]